MAQASPVEAKAVRMEALRNDDDAVVAVDSDTVDSDILHVHKRMLEGGDGTEPVDADEVAKQPRHMNIDAAQAASANTVRRSSHAAVNASRGGCRRRRRPHGSRLCCCPTCFASLMLSFCLSPVRPRRMVASSTWAVDWPTDTSKN